MKSKLKILATVMTLFVMNPAFAQDMASYSVACCGTTETSEDSNKQITMDPLQWAATGIEGELIGNMTLIVREKMQHDQVVNENADQATTVKSVRHSKKSIHSKQ